MPDDCGLKPPIETLPQIAQARAIVVLVSGWVPRRRAGRVERVGMIADVLVPSDRPARPADLACRRPRPAPPDRDATPPEEAVTDSPVPGPFPGPTPGRSIVTRRALVDVVRAA